MDICTFWYGSQLRPVDHMCLTSMVRTGQRVKLFSYQPVENLPEGVEQHDAATIMPIESFRRLDPGFPNLKDNLTIVQFSDIFRINLMKHRQGVWLDTDVYLHKQFHPDASKPYLARENRERVGVSALYFPPDHPVIAEFDAYMAGDYPLPKWLGLRRRVLRPLWYRLIGKEVTPAMIGITIFGNDGISRLAKKYGCFNNAAPKESFYYWTARDCLNIFDPKYGLEPLNHPEFIGFHVHRKSPEELVARKGSFYEWMLKQTGELTEAD